MRARSCSLVFLTLAVAASGFAEPRFSHGVTNFVDLKYPEGFPHFAYVNPDAPKGGTLVLATAQNFNSFTPIIPRGIRPPGIHVIELAMLYDPLFWPSDDEPGSFYGNLVESVALADDYSWAVFRLRPEARWHDGMPVTARDVKFTFDWIAEDGAGGVRQAFQFIEGSEILGEREIRFRFRNVSGLSPINVIVMAKWPIIPEHYWRQRDRTRTTLEPPLGSGPYRVAEFRPGRYIRYERVPDYWGRHLGIHRADTTSTPSATRSIATRPSPAKPCARAWWTTGRKPIRATGRPATTSRPGTRAGWSSVATRACRTWVWRARLRSTRARKSSPTAACDRRSPWRSTTSGATAR